MTSTRTFMLALLVFLISLSSINAECCYTLASSLNSSRTYVNISATDVTASVTSNISYTFIPVSLSTLPNNPANPVAPANCKPESTSTYIKYECVERTISFNVDVNVKLQKVELEKKECVLKTECVVATKTPELEPGNAKDLIDLGPLGRQPVWLIAVTAVLLVIIIGSLIFVIYRRNKGSGDAAALHRPNTDLTDEERGSYTQVPISTTPTNHLRESPPLVDLTKIYAPPSTTTTLDHKAVEMVREKSHSKSSAMTSAANIFPTPLVDLSTPSSSLSRDGDSKLSRGGSTLNQKSLDRNQKSLDRNNQKSLDRNSNRRGNKSLDRNDKRKKSQTSRSTAERSVKEDRRKSTDRVFPMQNHRSLERKKSGGRIRKGSFNQNASQVLGNLSRTGSFAQSSSYSSQAPDDEVPLGTSRKGSHIPHPHTRNLEDDVPLGNIVKNKKDVEDTDDDNEVLGAIKERNTLERKKKYGDGW